MSTHTLQIFGIADRDRIKKLLMNCPKADIHQDIDYLIAFEHFTTDQLMYVHYRSNTDFLLIPYFKRVINSDYYDIVSPWYYGGYTFSTENKEVQKELFTEFLEEFTKYCQENKIVSEFQRLNPILKNHELYLNKEKNLFFDRDVVFCDLKKDYETIRSEYNRSVRKNINKAVKNELIVVQDESSKSVAEFIKIYCESMDRKKAGEFYYFSKEFFEELFSSLKGHIKLFHVKHENKVISSTIVVGNGTILHDYLRGADPEHVQLRPNNIAVDTIIQWAKKEGYHYYSFGGGATNNPDDGILRFKKTFSPETEKFYLYKKIHDTKVYEGLCKKKNSDDIQYEEASFFPEYRKPVSD